MKTFRIAGMIAAVAAGLLIVAIALLYALFDGEKIKAELAAQVYAKTQRKLAIEGAVSLSVWPDVALRLPHLTLSEPGSDAGFAALDSARVAVAVMPLLSKHVDVKRVELDGLALSLVKRKDGSLNIADLMGQDVAAEANAKVSPGGTAPANPPAAPEAATPLHLDVAAIAIRNARLSWRDETSGKTTNLSDLALTTGRLRGDTDSASYQVEKLTFSTHGTTGADRFEATLAAPLIGVSGDKITSDSLQLSVTLAGKARNVTARLGLDKVEGSANAVRIGRLTLDLDARAGDASVKGRLESPLAVDSKAQTVALEKISGALDIASPALPKKQLRLPIAGSLRADRARQTASLGLDTRVDDSTVALKLTVPKFAPLALAFDLGIDRLDLDKYLPAASAATEPAPGAGGGEGGNGGEAKLDLSALKEHDVRGSLRVGQLQARRIKLARLDARIALAGGRLEIAPLGAELYGGTLSGSLGANANGNSIAAKQTLSNVAIAPLLTDATGKAPLEGRGTVNIDINTHGGTLNTLKKALAGNAALSLKDGAVKGINLAKSLREIKTRLGARQDSTAAANAADKTDFSELSASFRIANGVAHNDDLAMKSPFLRLGGAGDIDLGNERIDYLAKVSVVNTSGGQEGKDLEHLKGITVPVRLTGPFTQLSYKLELGSLVREAAKAKVEEKKQELKTRAEEKLKDKLKGLFGK